VLDVSLPKLGEQGKGLFTKELEDEMFAGTIDLAVHSLKDLPTELPEGLTIGAICEREDVRDAFVARGGIANFAALRQDAVVGTSSVRREAQLRARRPDLQILPVRGNVDTRLRKLDEGEFDAIILAAAGLRRLGYDARITEYLDSRVMLSAVGQGALAIETRETDGRVNELLKALDHQPTRLACAAERAFLTGLGGGCIVPIAALCSVVGRELTLDGLVAKPDGSKMLRA
jgi:hydroxymethylbilane synthase